MTLLDELQGALSEVGGVKVAARFKSDKLRFADPHDLRIFIPDIHLMPSSGRQHFVFGGAHPSHSLLSNTLKRLITLRAAIKAATPSAICAVYFMGDFFDLWRSAAPGGDPVDAADAIALEHADLVHLACGPELKARFLLGNHDFELCKVPSFTAADRRFFFPATSPSTLAIHGDVFDWVEDFPDLLNEVILYYLSPFANLLDHTFDKIKGLIHASNRKPEHIAPNEVTQIPPEDAETKVLTSRDEAESKHPLFKRAFQCRSDVGGRFGLDLRSFVIGHTHGPRIVPYESGADFFALIDTGGWLEDVRDNTGARARGMITGLSQNEVRIFELSE